MLLDILYEKDPVVNFKIKLPVKCFQTLHSIEIGLLVYTQNLQFP